MLETLREDFSRLPELLALPEPPQDALDEIPPAAVATTSPAGGETRTLREPGSGERGNEELASGQQPVAGEPALVEDQLGLF
jgi:hypothetical protein